MAIELLLLLDIVPYLLLFKSDGKSHMVSGPEFLAVETMFPTSKLASQNDR